MSIVQHYYGHLSLGAGPQAIGRRRSPSTAVRGRLATFNLPKCGQPEFYRTMSSRGRWADWPRSWLSCGPVMPRRERSPAGGVDLGAQVGSLTRFFG
jgi:hypothetical protein